MTHSSEVVVILYYIYLYGILDSAFIQYTVFKVPEIVLFTLIVVDGILCRHNNYAESQLQ